MSLPREQNCSRMCVCERAFELMKGAFLGEGWIVSYVHALTRNAIVTWVRLFVIRSRERLVTKSTLHNYVCRVYILAAAESLYDRLFVNNVSRSNESPRGSFGYKRSLLVGWIKKINRKVSIFLSISSLAAMKLRISLLIWDASRRAKTSAQKRLYLCMGTRFKVCLRKHCFSGKGSRRTLELRCGQRDSPWSRRTWVRRALSEFSIAQAVIDFLWWKRRAASFQRESTDQHISRHVSPSDLFSLFPQKI